MPDAVKARLQEVYGEHYADEIDARTGDEIVELAQNLKPGVPMGTPVFDGARESGRVRRCWRWRGSTRRVSRTCSTGAPATSSTAR